MPSCSLPSSRSASSAETGTDIAHHFGMREVDLFDIGRRIADMDHLRPVRPHQERRLLDRVVTDRDDQVGPVDRLVDIVPLRERGCAHVEIVAAGTVPLPICVLKKGIWVRRDEVRQAGAQARAAGGGAQHHQRPLGLEDHLGRAVERRRRRYRHARSDAAAPWEDQELPRPRYLPAIPDEPALAAPPWPRGKRRARRWGWSPRSRSGGSILVSGRIVATMSTIWKRACRLVMIPFWPVIRIIGMAPRYA